MLKVVDCWVREGSYPNRSRSPQAAVRARQTQGRARRHLAHTLKGGIYWADLNPVRAKERAVFRPVLILGNDQSNGRSGTAIALAITSRPQKAGFPLTFPLPQETLAQQAWVKLSQIRTIPVERLGKRLATVDNEKLDRILDGLIELIT